MAQHRDPQPPSSQGPPAPAPPAPPDLAPDPDLTDLALADTHPGDLLEGVALSASGTRVDLAGARILTSRMDLGGMGEVGLRGARLSEVVFAAPDCTVMRAPFGQWRDVVIDGGRIGTAEAYDAEWVRVALRGVRVRYLNLRAARIRDLALSDCVIDELDLGGAELARVALLGTRVGRLELSSARLEEVDLRGARFETLVGARDLAGAVIDAAQLLELAPVLAAAVGVRVV